MVWNCFFVDMTDVQWNMRKVHWKKNVWGWVWSEMEESLFYMHQYFCFQDLMVCNIFTALTSIYWAYTEILRNPSRTFCSPRPLCPPPPRWCTPPSDSSTGTCWVWNNIPWLESKHDLEFGESPTIQTVHKELSVSVCPSFHIKLNDSFKAGIPFYKVPQYPVWAAHKNMEWWNLVL